MMTILGAISLSLAIILLTTIIILGLQALLARIMGGGIQQSGEKSCNPGTGDNTHKLMALYGLSTAVGFVGLKIASMIV